MMSSMKTISVPPGATIKEQIADRGIAYSVGVVHPDRFKLNTPAAETEQSRRRS